MDNPFGDSLFEQFMIYDQFFVADVPCPWCCAIHALDVKDGDNDDRYLCAECEHVFSVDWVARTCRPIQ